MGPMTGRAAGSCAGFAGPGYMTPVPGRGLGFGRGRGLGFGRGLGVGLRRGRGGWRSAGPDADAAAYSAPYGPAFAAPTVEQERDVLQNQAERLEGALDGVRKRIAELESAKRDTK